MQGGDFSGISNTIYDPATRMKDAAGVLTATPFAGNMIPTNRIDPISKKLLEFYPAANLATRKLTSNYQRTSGTADQQGPVRAAHGLPGIVQVVVVRPL